MLKQQQVSDLFHSFRNFAKKNLRGDKQKMFLDHFNDVEEELLFDYKRYLENCLSRTTDDHKFLQIKRVERGKARP